MNIQTHKNNKVLLSIATLLFLCIMPLLLTAEISKDWRVFWVSEAGIDLLFPYDWIINEEELIIKDNKVLNDAWQHFYCEISSPFPLPGMDAPIKIHLDLTEMTRRHAIKHYTDLYQKKKNLVEQYHTDFQESQRNPALDFYFYDYGDTCSMLIVYETVDGRAFIIYSDMPKPYGNSYITRYYARKFIQSSIKISELEPTVGFCLNDSVVIYEKKRTEKIVASGMTEYLYKERIVKKLKKGDMVYYFGEKSSFTTESGIKRRFVKIEYGEFNTRNDIYYEDWGWHRGFKDDVEYYVDGHNIQWRYIDELEPYQEPKVFKKQL